MGPVISEVSRLWDVLCLGKHQAHMHADTGIHTRRIHNHMECFQLLLSMCIFNVLLTTAISKYFSF